MFSFPNKTKTKQKQKQKQKQKENQKGKNKTLIEQPGIASIPLRHVLLGMLLPSLFFFRVGNDK